MKKVLTFILMYFIIGAVTFASNDNKAFSFLNLPFNPHSAALGGTNITLSTNNIANTFDNPALLSYDQSNQLSLNYMNYVSDINMGSVIYGKSVGLRGVWSAGILFMNYGKFTETTPENIVIGSFSANDLAFMGTYSYELSDRLRAGITGKIIYSGYERYTSWGIGVDLGLNYFRPEKGISASIALKNLGGQIKSFHDSNEKLPWDIQLGISKKMEYAPFRFSLTAYHLNKWDMSIYREDQDNTIGEETAGPKKDNFFLTLAKHLVFGVDFTPTENVYFSLGFNPQAQSEFSITGKKGIYGFSFGTGLQVKRFQIDASYFQRNPKGGTFMLGITTSFDSQRF
ncbi:MAG: type IX secretion system protein PorQ [Bacteroidales bacterium]